MLWRACNPVGRRVFGNRLLAVVSDSGMGYVPPESCMHWLGSFCNREAAVERQDKFRCILLSHIDFRCYSLPLVIAVRLMIDIVFV